MVNSFSESLVSSMVASQPTHAITKACSVGFLGFNFKSYAFSNYEFDDFN